MPLPGMRSADTEVYSELKIIAVDKGVPSQQAKVKLLVDSCSNGDLTTAVEGWNDRNKDFGEY